MALAGRGLPTVAASEASAWRRLAERVGFEPTVEFPLHTLSKRAPSTTRPSLRLFTIKHLRAVEPAALENSDGNCDTSSNLRRSLTGLSSSANAA